MGEHRGNPSGFCGSGRHRRPQYLLDEILEDPATALDFLEQQQQRLLGLIPHLLHGSRQGALVGTNPDPATTHLSLGRLAREIRTCLTDILEAGATVDAAERVLKLERRQSHLEALEHSTWHLVSGERASSLSSAMEELQSQLVESLDGGSLVAIDAMASRGLLGIEILVGMTGDRGEMMRAARAGLQERSEPLDATQRTPLCDMTSVFERTIWIRNQLGASLASEASMESPNASLPAASKADRA